MNQRSLNLIVSLLMFSSLVIVTACIPSTESEAVLEVVTVMATRSATQTAVPTYIPTATETVTPLPTQTNTPTAAPTHIPTATKTPIPLPTQTSTPDPVSPLTPPSIPTPEISARYESPSGEWIVTLEKGDFFNEPDSYLFRAVNGSGEVEWVIEHLVPDPLDGGMSLKLPVTLDWSINEQIMYFTYAGFGDGCGPFREHLGLSRLDLQTGQIEELIGLREGYWVAVAPNDEKAAYMKFGNFKELILLDFSTREEVVIELDYDPAIEYINFSDLVWSPDSNSLLALGVEDVCATGMLDGGRVFITRIDLQSLFQEMIVEDSTLREILDWREPEKVLLRVSIGNAQSKNVWLNPETGEITPADE